MRQLIIASALTLITACTGITKKPIPVPIPSALPIPKADNQIVEKKVDDIPRSLKINMTLSNPDNLKIKSGQTVNAADTAYFGQMRYRVNGENLVVRALKPAIAVPHNNRKRCILSDIVTERRSLLEKKKLLQLSLQEVSRKIPSPPKPLELPNIPELPKADFSKEEAAIEKAKLSLSEQSAIVTKQKELVLSLKSAGISQDAIAQEQARLAIAELNYLQSKVNLDQKMRSQASPFKEMKKIFNSVFQASGFSRRY